MDYIITGLLSCILITLIAIMYKITPSTPTYSVSVGPEQPPKREREAYTTKVKHGHDYPSPKAKKKRGRKRKRTAWERKRMSKAQQSVWDNLTPEQRRIRIDKMTRARKLSATLKNKV